MGDNVASCSLRSQELCNLCDQSQSKYTCPRCNILYCSLSCYRSEKHSYCSETFYKECVQEELKSMTTDSKSKNKMNAVLQDFLKNQSVDGKLEDKGSMGDEEDSDYSFDSDDLGEELKENDVDVDHPNLWQSLTKEQQEDFKNMLVSGRILQVLPEVTVWWLSGTELPELHPDIPDITTLLSRPAAPSMPYLIMNALMAYQITLRSLKAEKYYFGEAATGMYYLSSALRGDHGELNSLDDAVDLIMKDLPKCSWASELENNIKKDLRDLTLVNSENILLALSDMKEIYDYSTNRTKGLTQSFTGVPPSPKILKGITKKVVFYLAFMKKFSMSDWASLLGT